MGVGVGVGMFFALFVCLSRNGEIALTRSYLHVLLVCLFVCFVDLFCFVWNNDITTLPITTVCTISLCDEVKVYPTEEKRERHRERERKDCENKKKREKLVIE